MATTAQKKTDPASPRKSGTGSARGASTRASAGSSRGNNTGSGRSGGRGKAPEPQRPIRREVWALVCLFLGIFTALGYFNVEAVFIDLLTGVVKGLRLHSGFP